jgi:7-carboxy-7-deazaguanine synthase
VSLQVKEIFYSIQGESSYAGYPCVFIRLAGCNLRCSYCDTGYAYEGGTDMEVQEIISQVKSFRCPLVEVTGGEPLIQEETPRLICRLLDEGYKVLLETNGSLDVSTVDSRCVKIMDIKGPLSCEMEKNDFDNLERLTGEDEIKFIIGDRTDYEYAKKTLSLIRKRTSTRHIIHFSPLFGRMPLQTLAAWIMEDRLPVRLHLQFHKLIWPEETRGM